MSSDGESSRSEVLNRIQKETQRLKNRKKRLEVDHQQGSVVEVSVVEQPESAITSAGLSSSSSSTKKKESRPSDPSSTSKGKGKVSRTTAAALVIEPSTGSYFEDPVPAHQMSSHLKSEHEAFKAR
jgi:hypothetical protein